MLTTTKEPKFRPAGLRTLVVNEDTTNAARLNGSDIWDRAPEVDVVLLGPEQLTTKGFERLLKNKEYQKRVMALAVDEVHLLTSWGLSFRNSFTHIGTARKRFDNSPILIALTATLRAGEAFDSVCKFLGLYSAQYFLIRRSNQRHDLRFLFRTVQSTARAFRFPELDWVLLEKRRVIVFCRTIALTFRVGMYLRTLAESMSSDTAVGTEDIEERAIRMYTALNWESYNAVTLELMHTGTRRSWVTVATDTLSVGVDIASTDDVVLYDFQLPTDTDCILQKAGRIRDGRGRDSKVVIYLPKTAQDTSIKALSTVADTGAPGTVVKTGKGKQSISIDIGVAKLVTASCKVKALDELYDNPPTDPLCTCTTCAILPVVPRPDTCQCSGCQPEQLVLPPSRSKPRVLRPKVPAGQRITQKMRKHAGHVLHTYRKAQRDATDDWNMLPAEEILPDDLITTLLDRFSEVVDISTLRTVTQEHGPLVHRYHTLWPVIERLRTDFDTMRAQAKKDQADKRRATTARKQAEKLASREQVSREQITDAEVLEGSNVVKATDCDRENSGSDGADSDGEDSDNESLNTDSDRDSEVSGDPEAEEAEDGSAESSETGIARPFRCTIVIPARASASGLPAVDKHTLTTIRIPPRRHQLP